jgi:Na+-transporting NADH:ubiquinone oxidoreductase subunit NqrF
VFIFGKNKGVETMKRLRRTFSTPWYGSRSRRESWHREEQQMIQDARDRLEAYKADLERKNPEKKTEE